MQGISFRNSDSSGHRWSQGSVFFNCFPNDSNSHPGLVTQGLKHSYNLDLIPFHFYSDWGPHNDWPHTEFSCMLINQLLFPPWSNQLIILPPILLCCQQNSVTDILQEFILEGFIFKKITFPILFYLNVLELPIIKQSKSPGLVYLFIFGRNEDAFEIQGFWKYLNSLSVCLISYSINLF